MSERNPKNDPRPGDIFIDDSDDYEVIVIVEVTDTHITSTDVTKSLITNQYTTTTETIRKEDFLIPYYYKVLHKNDQIDD